MSTVATLLLAFDNALDHPWESLSGALGNVHALTDAEARWQHPAYAHEPHDKGVGRPGSVLWFLNHLEHCHRHYARVLARTRKRKATKASTKAKPLHTKPPGELPLAKVLPALEKANAALRAELAALKAADLVREVQPGNPVAEFVVAAIRHIAWHSGQIATIRRMYGQA